MQLIYLWIKSYKNINELGAVLNSNFQEKEKTVYENDKIIVKLKETNSINIFQENLNIKTIVGSNGSGKSNFLSALASVLRNGYTQTTEDYFDFTPPDEYFLLYKDKNVYKYKSKSNNIEVFIDDKKINPEKDETIVKNALFCPFLRLRDDTFLTFPQDEHMSDITSKKVDNYFYYDRFRTYDTSHSLRELFDKNKNLNNKLKMLSGSNKYLIFVYIGYELDIAEEFEWLNRQLNIKIPIYYQKSNINYDEKWNLVDALVKSNIFIMQHPKTYNNIDNFLNIVVSNACFMFLLIKLADLFCSQEGNENIIKFKWLKKTVDSILLYENDVPINLNEINMPRKHEELCKFYKDVQKQFNKCKSDKSIKIPKKLKEDLTNFLKAAIKLENDLLNNQCELFATLRKRKNRNIYLPNNKFLRLVKYKSLNKELKFLNDLGIFKQSFYKKTNNDDVYSFYDLSTGEQRLLRFFGDILSVINQDIDILMFDEMDLSWHPEWQRKMVYYITDFLENLSLDKSINIIFTTHSPFILSDMSIDNVIMLYRDDEDYTRIYRTVDNTFGANIHDLFNNNFFFNDCDGICTMGEFSKKYIQKIQSQLSNISDNEVSPEKIYEIEQKIKIIGEPIIRETLLAKLYSNQMVQKYNRPEKLYVENIKLKEQLESLKRILNEKA